MSSCYSRVLSPNKNGSFTSFLFVFKSKSFYYKPGVSGSESESYTEDDLFTTWTYRSTDFILA